jgi:hypothetical protein
VTREFLRNAATSSAFGCFEVITMYFAVQLAKSNSKLTPCSHLPVVCGRGTPLSLRALTQALPDHRLAPRTYL